ncbi:MAG: Fic family protein [Dongiaceae bacterium]
MLTSVDNITPDAAPRAAGRAGRYVRQPTGYSAFIPAPLPPDPPVAIDAELQQRLSAADRALGRLDGSIHTLPDPDLFVLMYVRKEAVLSSQIEGTQSSLTDVLKAEAEIFDPDAPRDVAEVINYIAAMNLGLERLKELPVSLRLIRDIHARLMQGVRGGERAPGEFRRSQNWIGPAGATLREATFVPPPPDVAEAALGDLDRFLHADDRLPPLVRIGLAHAQFETIHPFLDGNGRVGRLLIAFLLCERKLLEKPVLYISWYLRAHRQEYYERLQQTRDSGDWEGWLNFFLRGIAEAADQAADTARRILLLRETHRRAIAERLGSSGGRGARLLDHLYRRPTVSVTEVARLIGVSFPNANKLVDQFVKLELLTEITGHARNRRFLYAPYTELFADA